MALVVFLKGINVGGHRRFRPSVLANELKRLDVVSVGATGTFVVRKPVTRAKVRAEIARRLPFEADIMICDGQDLLRLVSVEPFGGQRSAADIIQFVGILAKRPHMALRVPFDVPRVGAWCVRVLGQKDRFVFGLHRRQMKAIGYLGQLETMLGVAVTIRSWNTILRCAAIADSADSRTSSVRPARPV